MSIDTAIIHQINSLIEKQFSFSLYRLPAQQEPIFRLQTNGEPCCVQSITQLNEKSGFVIAPFVETKDCPIVLIQPDVSAFGWKEITRTLNNLNENELVSHTEKKEINFNTQSVEKEAYCQLFEKFIEPLRKHQFEKLVLSRSLNVKREESFSPLQAFVEACERYPLSFVYLCHTPYSGTWLGSTSETILSGDKSGWNTMAMAGTMPLENGQAPQDWDDKNKHEQALVADYIRHQLDSLQINISEKGPYTTQAGQLVHLKSDFYFSLPDNNQLGMLLNLLHPTPAVCGLPKKEAYQFILENEGYSRSYYSGFLGWLDPSERTDLYVNLRCMNIQLENLTLYAGGGILPTSEVNTEWEETQAKMKTMQALLNS